MDVTIAILLVLTFTASHCRDVGDRQKRAVTGNIEIETVVVLDADYVANQKKNGYSTRQSLEDLMKLKWTGVQAEWGRENVFNYTVTISIKEIVIWETNPSWYSPSTFLDSTLLSICKGVRNNNLWTNFDHIHLFTGTMGTDVSGKAYTGEICVNGRKCAVSAVTRVDEYVITAHELGHSMGMAHDGDVGCMSPNDGIMGGKTAGWSRCSVAAFKVLVTSSSSSCLQTTNVAQEPVFSLPEAWPGMVYTLDEICEFKYGVGFRLKTSRTSCSGGTCIYLGPDVSMQGVMFSYPTPTDGSYCGDQQVCSSQIVGGAYHCISLNGTGLDTQAIVQVPGGWSEWGDMTSCSRTCGSGIRYKKRLCNNPKPRNSDWCEKDEYFAELCNPQPCKDDEVDEGLLIKQRAGETCAQWNRDNVFRVIGKNLTNYLDTGSKNGNNGDSQCEVQCDTVDGYSAGNERHGIMPDGTPCTLGSLSSYEDVNGLPRRSGRRGRCVRGFCYCFGCDNTTACTFEDGCGLCGGDDSTCDIVTGIYDTIVPSKSRYTVADLPKNSYRIQFSFAYNSMKYHFLELLDNKTSERVINFRQVNTMNDPVDFAGTLWYLNAYKQYLYADGPTNQSVIIQLYNYGSTENSGVNYAYSVHKDCGLLPHIKDGLFINISGDTGFGSTVNVSCNPGFVRNKPTIQCTQGGVWESAQCVRKDCGSLPQIKDGFFINISGDTDFGSMVNVSCNPGFVRTKPAIQCTQGGVWETARCVPKVVNRSSNIYNFVSPLTIFAFSFLIFKM